MADVGIAVARSRFGSIGGAVAWLFRILIAVVFAYIGYRKLTGAAMWATIFDHIGAGQWFRYLTGTLQLTGALLLLVPGTFLIGVWFIGCTMVGAMVTWIFVFREPRSALLPAILLAVLAGCVMHHVRAAR